MKKKVIDADNQRVIETFDVSETERVKAKYEAMGKWSDISVDIDGDIILWEE